MVVLYCFVVTILSGSLGGEHAAEVGVDIKAEVNMIEVHDVKFSMNQ